MGGTFDPIHFGHLAIAEEVRVRLDLAEVIFVPAAEPPHKQGVPRSPAEDRYTMVKLATASNPHFSVSRLDLDRPGPSFTFELLELLKAERGEDVELYFVVGLDELPGFLTWRRPERILQLARLAVLPRPGYSFDPAPLQTALPRVMERIDLVPGPELAISAVELRRRVRVGLPIKYMLPENVEEYIYFKGLYSTKEPSAIERS
jgi:nicotinate-nucleotide adenylyltransferase